MIVYGDHARRVDARATLARLEAELAAAHALDSLDRHATLVSGFIEASAFAQGVIDDGFARHGVDAPSPLDDAVMAWLTNLARAVDASWTTGFRDRTRPPGFPEARLADLPETITAKLAEGFAFYALYPESYAEAARRAGLGPDSRIVGLRSIGTGLAAMAAAAAGAPPPRTVRPVGPPFERVLALSLELAAALGAERERSFAVADEGPGLSGSSFGAAADALEAAGVARARIVFLPSHPGDLGPQASDAHRTRWAAAHRETAPFDALIAPRLAAWTEPLTGPAISPMEDVSGGGWRGRLYCSEADWPAVDAGMERRKFRLETARGAFRLKFAGLGDEGRTKLARAQTLADAGFGPPTLGLVHGFLVEPWLEGARPLTVAPADRTRAAERVGDYLAFRAGAFPAGPDDGASPEALFEMAQVNAREGLGADAGRRLERWASRLPDLAARTRRVATDNRLHLPEWLALPDGRLLKTDGLDHARAHDLIGAQDLAWDVAGATVEFDLADDVARALAARLQVDPELSAFSRAAYLAFQLGAHAMAADAHAGWAEEAARLAGARERYAERLARELG